jgi:2-C-methyl-D-erythritol 4-phosphate cytidylyltransferase
MHAFGQDRRMTNAWGIVPTDGRGSLPFVLVHGESLVSTAAYALEAADVELLDPAADWAIVRAEGLPLVLHDPACPLTPVDFILRAVDQAVETGAVVAGCRPVTYTVKVLGGEGAGTLGATVDREALVEITSPLVLPAAVVEAIDGVPAGAFADIVDLCRRHWPVQLLTAPPLGRRVRDAQDVTVLEALSLAG